MDDRTRRLRSLRSSAFSAALRRLRSEYPREQRQLCVRFHGWPNPSQSASTELRRRHPQRAAELYCDELARRGLPAPVDRGPS